MKKFRGKIFEDNLWPSAYTYTPRRHDTFFNNIYTQPKVKKIPRRTSHQTMG
jgi:hypothetical protein